MPGSGLRHYLEHYLAPHPSNQVRELLLSTAILDFASGSVALFEPIYLFTLGFPIGKVLLYYAILYAAFLFLLPVGGRIGRRYGYEHAILYSSPFLVLYLGALYAVQLHAAFFVIAPLLFAVQKVLYWPAYHANFATFAGDGEGGREVSNLYAIHAVAAGLAPAFGGLIIAASGFPTLFAVAGLLIILSNLPLFRTPDLPEARPFPYGRAFARLIDRKNRRKVIAYLGWGQEVVALVLWPIFIVTVLGNMFAVGTVVSLAMLTNLAVTLYVGRIADEEGERAVLRTGVVYTAASWLVRPFVVGGLGIFLIDSFYRVTINTFSVPFLSMLYAGARRGSPMDEVVLMEMALAVGKIVVIGLCAAAFMLWPGTWMPAFAIAAVFTVLFGFMPDLRKDAV